MVTLNSVEQFRIGNGLYKKDLADYLGVSQAFIGRVCAGIYKIPPAQLQKLINNDKGWDVTALTQEETEEPVITANSSGIDLLNKMFGTLSKVEQAQVACMELIRSKDEQIERLTKIIENLAAK